MPTVIEPLRADWVGVQGAAASLIEAGKDLEARQVVEAFHTKLAATKVLDPACSTGNFLYVALARMKKLEGEVVGLLAELGADQYVAELTGHTRRVEEAARASKPDVDVKGLLEAATEDGTPPPARLPVNDQSRAALASLAPFSETPNLDSDTELDAEEAQWDAATQGKLFLVVHDNFEEVDYAPLGLTENLDETLTEPIKPPTLLQSTLKSHQVEGLTWLAHNTLAGRPGALLADDMGLGKTIQAIAFMAWLQYETAEARRPRAPFLIVAPTGLLGTWRTEIEKHLGDPQLGSLVPAFGGNLKLLRDEDSFPLISKRRRSTSPSRSTAQEPYPCTVRRRRRVCARNCAPAPIRQRERQERQRVSSKTPHPQERAARDRVRP